ncbi:MAG: ATP-binding cassette domain-containing protein [Leptospirales bacterium]|nr:ATP-binding cassette domain-containing protein [Leptospirales bacterium]
MIEVAKVSKSYGDFQALSSIDFKIDRQHGITALLGPNGAGKTTTLRLITGYLQATSGEIRVGGISVDDEQRRVEVKRLIGYLPESTALYPEMLISEYLEFMGRVRGLDGETLERRAEEMVGELELGSHYYSPLGILSKGFKQRVALAGALIHDPPYVILDEPTSGLDPNQIAHIRALIKKLGKKSILILSTHILAEVEDICDRVIIMSRGRIVADQPAHELRAAHASCMLVARGEGIAARLKECPIVSAAEKRERPDLPEGFQAIVCQLRDDRPEELFAFVARQGWEVRELAPLTRSLQEVFSELTR